MAIKKSKLLFPVIFLFINFVLLSSSCKKKEKPCGRYYTFEHPVSVFPVKDSYNIGDTIWFEINFSDTLKNTIVKDGGNGVWTEDIIWKNADFQQNFFSVIKLVDSTKNTGSQIGGWSSFTPLYDNIELINFTDYGPKYKLIYSSSRYITKIGLKTSEKGKFMAVFSFLKTNPSYMNVENQVKVKGECDVEYIEGIEYPINRQNNGTFLTNYHLFANYMNPNLEPNLEKVKNQTFTFIVN